MHAEVGKEQNYNSIFSNCRLKNYLLSTFSIVLIGISVVLHVNATPFQFLFVIYCDWVSVLGCYQLQKGAEGFDVPPMFEK